MLRLSNSIKDAGDKTREGGGVSGEKWTLSISEETQGSQNAKGKAERDQQGPRRKDQDDMERVLRGNKGRSSTTWVGGQTDE